MNNPRLLRRALTANALFSLASGAVMASVPASVGEWMGLQATLNIRVIGVCLVLFAADLLHQATRPRVATWRVLVASLGDFLWVLATFVLLLIFPDSLSALGQKLVIAVAVAVLGFGGWQVWALRLANSRPIGYDRSASRRSNRGPSRVEM